MPDRTALIPVRQAAHPHPPMTPARELLAPEVREIYFPRGIIGSRAPAEVKLTALQLWHRAGCCYASFPFSARNLFLGADGSRTLTKWIRAGENAGWYELEAHPNYPGLVQVTFNGSIWRIEARQRWLEQMDPNTPPPLFGGNHDLPALLLPLPLLAFDAKRLNNAHKLLAWYSVVLLTPDGSARIEFSGIGRAFSLDPAQIRRSIQKLSSSWLCIVEERRGLAIVRPKQPFYFQNQVSRLKHLCECDPAAGRQFLRLIAAATLSEAPPAERFGAPSLQARCAGLPAAPMEETGAPSHARCAGLTPAPTEEIGAPSHARRAGGPIDILSESESQISFDPIESDQMERRKRTEERAQEIRRRLAGHLSETRAFIPLLIAALPEFPERNFSEETLKRMLDRAQRRESPARSLVWMITDKAGERLTAAMAKQILPQVGIPWRDELTDNIEDRPPEPDRAAARQEVLKKRAETLLYEERNRRRPDRSRPSCDEANAQYLERAKAEGIPEEVARALL